MRHCNLKRTLCVLISAILCVSPLTACDKKEEAQAETNAVAEPMELMELEDVDTMSFDFIGGTDVMPLAGYYGPQAGSHSANGQAMPDSISEEFMQMAVDCGINIFSANGAEFSTWPNRTMELLELCETYNIGLFVNDWTINANLGENALSLKAMDEQLQNYVNHPACIGVYVVDEPRTETYNNHVANGYVKDYGPVVRNLTELGVIPYTNLFPSIGEIPYRAYLTEFLDTCPVPFLSYDRYLFDQGNDLKYANDYFVNMALVREAAEERGIPFWCFVQAGAQWNDGANRFDSTGYWPEQGAFLWMANTSLAFGAKGLQYFPLLQPYYFAYAKTQDYDFERNGLISAWGTKNRWWYYAQIANKQIAAVDEVLMNSVNKGIIASDAEVLDDFKTVEYVIEGTAWRELSDVRGKAMVGCFNYFGKSAFYIVNYDIEYAQKITMEFSDVYKMKVVQKGQESYYATDSLELSMSAGEGVLIVME